jgi:hypothetical protein
MSDVKRFVTERLGMSAICALRSLIAAEGNIGSARGETDCRKAGRLPFCQRRAATLSKLPVSLQQMHSIACSRTALVIKLEGEAAVTRFYY